MTARHARLRDDLVVSEQETPAGKVFIVKDVARSRFFRLREPEFRLAQQLDGDTPLEVARRNVEARFAARIAPDTLERFVEKLVRLGLVEADGAGPSPPGATPGRVRGSVLYLRLAAFDPDRFLGRLAARIGFVFTPTFVAASAGLGAVALAVTLAGRQEIAADLRHAWRPDALLLAWITVLTVAGIHEIAHGVVCKRFGGQVRELGFLLIYFQPALYCNVSDAWLFPERSRRLWVGFAGAYVELVLWGLATLLWRLTDTDSALNFAALVVMATTGAKLAINLNPLIKLDGYYLLSDYVGIPNLRQRSRDYVAARFRRMAPPGRPSRREARICLWYGLLAGFYSCALLTVVTLAFGSFLVSRYQGFGFVVFAGLVFVVFIRPRLRRPFGAAAADAPPRTTAMVRPTAVDGRASPAAEARVWLDQVRSALMNDPGDHVPPGERMLAGRSPRLQIAPAPVREPAPRDPTEPSDPHGESGPGGRVLGPRRIAWALVLAAGGLVLLFGRMGLSVSGEFTILPVEHVEVRAEVEGLIEQVAVDEGMEIRAGAPIARLSERDHRAALAKVAAQIDEKRAELKLLRAGPRVEEIAIARTGVEKAGERLTYARLHLDMLERDPQLVSRKERDEAREDVAVRRKELDEAHTRLDMLLAGTRPEQIEAAEAELAVLEAERARLDEQLRLLAVVSPIAGVVTTSKPREKVGQHVERGDLIADVHALRTVTAEIAVSEKDISDVRVGQPVALKARAYPWATFRGEVTSIAPVATRPDESQPARTVVVVTRLDNAALLLKPEMTGNAKIYAGQRRLLDLVTRRLARYVRVEFWSWW